MTGYSKQRRWSLTAKSTPSTAWLTITSLMAAMASNTLVNGECRCADAVNRVELIKGLCKHRLASMVYAEQEAKATRKAVSKATAEIPAVIRATVDESLTVEELKSEEYLVDLVSDLFR
jgi:hypothetical protein